MDIQRLILISLACPLLIFQSCSFNKYFYNPSAGLPEIKSNPNFYEISLRNKKGDTVFGLLLNPDNEPKVKGTILLIHGNSGNISRWIENAKPLYSQGYRILIFDYEGYGKSTGKPTHKNVVSDTELFLDYLNKQYGKVILWGLSLGGNLSVYIASRNAEKVNGLIVEAGFTSHNEIARTFVPPVVKPLVWLFLKSPYKSKKYVKQLHIPVLLAYSPTDKVVPFKMGKILFQNANEPKFFLELKGEHCYGIMNNTQEYFDLINNMQKYIH
jgi:hypothetical protein